MRKVAIGMVVVVILAGMVGFFIDRGGVKAIRGDAATSSSNAGAGFMESAPTPDVPGAPVMVNDQGLSAEKVAVQQTAGIADAVGAPSSGTVADIAASSGPVTVDARVIKTADLTVQVKDGGFNDAWDRAASVAEHYDGYIVSSSKGGDKTLYGSLTIRVPSGNFGSAMSELRGLGEPTEESVDGQDVTDQFVDLNARLRSWQAQAAVLLRLMDKANSIAETMTVQRELQQVQYQIEEIKGQMRQLRDQTSFSTIRMTIEEPGAVTPKPKTNTPQLSEAFAQAWAGFLGVLSLVIIGLGYIVPLGVMALGAWLVVRLVRRPRAKAATPIA